MKVPLRFVFGLLLGYSYQHIVSSNSHINDAHFWKEQDSHTSRKEHWMTPNQALVALILFSIEFNRDIYNINNENLSSSLLLAIIPLAFSI